VLVWQERDAGAGAGAAEEASPTGKPPRCRDERRRVQFEPELERDATGLVFAGIVRLADHGRWPVEFLRLAEVDRVVE